MTSLLNHFYPEREIAVTSSDPHYAENVGVENAARSKLRGVENAGVEISGGSFSDTIAVRLGQTLY